MSNPSTPQYGDSSTVGTKAKEAASTASQELKTRAQALASTAASEAAGYADQAKSAAADEVKGVASALRTAAEELRSGSPQERSFSQIAESLADVSDAMRDKDMGEMVSELNGFARRNPLLFLGSAALVGFAATRFAKASSSPAGRNGGYDDDHRASGPAPTDRDSFPSASAARSPAMSGASATGYGATTGQTGVASSPGASASGSRTTPSAGQNSTSSATGNTTQSGAYQTTTGARK